MSSDSQIEQVDEAAEQLEEAGEDKTRAGVWFARSYLVLLVVLTLGTIGGAVYFGVVEVGPITVSGTVDAGQAATWLVQGLVILFLGFTAAAVLWSFPFSFWSRLLSTVARIADAYELPSRVDARTEQDLGTDSGDNRDSGNSEG